MNKTYNIRYVSFDVWNTLIFPNPDYAKARTEFLCLITKHNYSFDEVKQIYSNIKTKIDKDAEMFGKSYPTTWAYNQLYDDLKLPNEHKHVIKAVFQLLFDYFPPIIPQASSDTIIWLAEQNIPWGIGSNTNFIAGDHMRDFLWNTSLSNFVGAVFSDEQPSAKPNPQFFHKVHQIACDCYDEDIKFSEILHVGDNPTCDIQGASQVGIHTALLESTGNLYDLVTNIIKNTNK